MANQNFQQLLLQSSVSHEPSEIILIKFKTTAVIVDQSNASLLNKNGPILWTVIDGRCQLWTGIFNPFHFHNACQWNWIFGYSKLDLIKWKLIGWWTLVTRMQPDWMWVMSVWLMVNIILQPVCPQWCQWKGNAFWLNMTKPTSTDELLTIRPETCSILITVLTLKMTKLLFLQVAVLIIPFSSFA